MADFIDYPIDTDPDELLQQCIDELRTFWPNWEPNESSLAYRGMAALCRIIAQGRDVAALVPEEIFRTVGASLFNIAAIESSPARATTTWVMVDNAGYGPIPTRTLVSVEGEMFQTDADITVPSGSTTQAGVPIVALEDGVAGSGLGTGGSTVDLEEAIGFVASVTLDATTAFGLDAEDNDVYVARLKETLTLYTDIPIHADDLAKRARLKFGPDVFRAVAIDMYDADTDTPNVEGHASVALQGVDGEPVATPVSDAVGADLTGTRKRLLNATIHMIDATYSYVDVDYAATAAPYADLTDATALADSILSDFFQPYAWGLTPGERQGWTNKTKVTLNDIVAELRAAGLLSVESVEIKIRAADGVTVLRAMAAADADLPGVAPLTRPGVFNGTVSAP